MEPFCNLGAIIPGLGSRGGPKIFTEWSYVPNAWSRSRRTEIVLSTGAGAQADVSSIGRGQRGYGLGQNV
jgi:hypothetical protein